jgi:hypothetical protein
MPFDGMRDNIGHAHLHGFIKIRVVEIMGPSRGGIVQNDFLNGRPVVSAYRMPKIQNGVDRAGHRRRFLDT